jgi:hypothetical protein
MNPATKWFAYTKFQKEGRKKVEVPVKGRTAEDAKRAAWDTITKYVPTTMTLGNHPREFRSFGEQISSWVGSGVFKLEYTMQFDSKSMTLGRKEEICPEAVKVREEEFAGNIYRCNCNLHAKPLPHPDPAPPAQEAAVVPAEADVAERV